MSNQKKFLIFFRKKNLIIFSQKKFFLYFGKDNFLATSLKNFRRELSEIQKEKNNTLKKFLLFQKMELSRPKKIDKTFSYF